VTAGAPYPPFPPSAVAQSSNSSDYCLSSQHHTNLVATFNGSASAQLLSNSSAAEPEKKNGEAEHEPKQTQGGRDGGHKERESREQREQNTTRGTETEKERARSRKEA